MQAGEAATMAQGLTQKLDYDDLARTPDDDCRLRLLDGSAPT